MDDRDRPASSGDDSARAGPPTAGVTSEPSAPLVFLLGGLGFLGGIAAFLADLVTGHDVLRSLVVNAAGALVLVGWAAADTLSDPDSAVDSRGGAAGTALLLYGVYLLGAGLVVGLTSIRHGRLGLALLCGGGAAVAALVGLVVFPTGAVVGDADDGDGAADGAQGPDGTGDDRSADAGIEGR